MILVDSSVLIDVLTGRTTLYTVALDRLWANEVIAVGDLMLAEVLQGCRSERTFQQARNDLMELERIVISDHAVATQAARYYRHLRTLGITVRKTIDTLIATRCILDDIPLLYSDRDFEPFVEHFGLKSALDLPEAR
jgi:predicted nucleic acid-binding protein